MVRYVGRRNADRTCVVTREHLAEGGWVREDMRTRYPHAVRFAWGERSPDRTELAVYILYDVIGCIVQARKLAEEFAEEFLAVKRRIWFKVEAEAVWDWYLEDIVTAKPWMAEENAPKGVG